MWKVLKIFKTLRNEAANLPVDVRTRMSIQHALDNGEVEVKNPGSGSRPDKEIVASSLEQATRILKSAGGTTEAVRSFIEKAERIGPYIGQAAGWLAGLLCCK